MVKISVGNIHSLLKTENKKLKSILQKKYTYKIPGYQYTKQYRKGWNGEKSFFSSKSGKFLTGLLYSIEADLQYGEIPYEVEDLRKPLPIGDTDVEGIELRPYQEDIVQRALELERCIIKAPTGSGKTVILAAILKALEGKTGLIFFTKKQLLHQTYKFLTKYGFDVGVAFGDGVDIKPVTLCTAQSIDKVLDSHLDTSDFIIFDEVHEFSKGKITSRMVKSFKNARVRIGMTATVPSEPISKLNIVGGLGQVIEEVNATELIGGGFLTEPTINIIDLEDEGTVEDTESTYFEIYEKYIVEYERRNNIICDIVKKINSYQNDRKTLIIVKNLAHAEILHKMIPGSLKLEGKDSLADRDRELKKFVSKGEQVIIGTTIFQTGVDIPEITHLINARGLKSEIATLQALGRALRIHKSKNQVHIYDFYDKVPYLHKHANLRIRAYKSLNLNIQTDETFKRRKTRT
jgi:superfamily II DNA or RNA helicase